MMSTDILGILFPSLAMGVMVSIDVSIATIGKIRDRSVSSWNWTVPVTIAHMLLLLTGYLIFWQLSLAYPWLQPALGVVGFGLVAFLVSMIIKEILCAPEPCGITDTIESKARGKAESIRYTVHVLAVSWDALLSGFVFANEGTVNDWQLHEIALSIFVVGVMVAILSEVSLYVTQRLQRIKFQNIIYMTRFNLAARFTELSVIGGFGVHSLTQGLFASGSLVEGIFISAIIMSFVFFILRKRLWEHSLAEARQIIYGDQ